MKTINVKKIDGEFLYPIFIGNDLMGKIGELFDFNRFSKIVILTDSNVAPLFLNMLTKGLNRDVIKIIIQPGEREKNINTIKKIWLKLIDSGCDRKSILINLGGGVVGDIGGFSASTFKRGISFLQIPTTLLAQVDASIGGKTAIDFGGIKNSVGLFCQTAGVFVDVDTLKTLPTRQLVSGFAEIIKHGVISDEKYFDLVTSKRPTEFSSAELIEIVRKSCLIKLKIVQKDEKENGLRKVLNFGHTIGHAIESLCLEKSIPILHGEAVAIGMIAESRLANQEGILNREDLLKIENAIKKAGLPTEIKNIRFDDLLTKIAMDKKNEFGKIKWSLPIKIGKVIFNYEIHYD